MSQTCPSCGTSIEEDAKYCSECGAALQKESAAIVGEKALRYQIEAYFRGAPAFILNIVIIAVTIFLLSVMAKTEPIGRLLRLYPEAGIIIVVLPLIPLNLYLYWKYLRE